MKSKGRVTYHAGRIKGDKEPYGWFPPAFNEHDLKFLRSDIEAWNRTSPEAQQAELVRVEVTPV